MAIFPGSRPVALIDGDRLINLLLEQTIDLKERPAILYDLDEDLVADPAGSATRLINDLDDKEADE